jgi:cholinesterase
VSLTAIFCQLANCNSWYGVSKALGCGGEEAGEKTLPCMRSKPYQDILKAMKSSGQTGMGSFGPTADGKVVFADYPQRLASGNFIKAPILVGNTDDEGGLSAALATLGKSSAPKVARRQTPTPAPNLSGIGCGPHAAALGRAKHGIPAWRYVYNAVFPNQDIGSKGAWHGADIGIVFGTQEFLSHEVCPR